MLKAYKYRLYPNRQQIELIEKTFGCCRYIYNKTLETKITTYQTTKKTPSYFALVKTFLPREKAKHEWLQEVPSQPLCVSMLNLDNAFTSFFRKQTKFPKFKSKRDSRQSFQYPQGVSIKDSIHIFLPKIGPTHFIQDRTLPPGKIKTVTVSKTPTKKYFVSILLETLDSLPPKAKVELKTTIGIDLGLKSYITISNGEKIDNPKFFRNNKARLAILQRRASRKVKGSKRRYKANLAVSRQHEKITNQRNDFLHKLSSRLVRENQTICIEDLAISNMMQNHNLAQAIGDAAWRTFVTFLTYKTDWYGKNLIKIGRFEASSKTCSVCGYVKHDLTLADREWDCPKCKTHHDRDDNASTNIKNFGLITHARNERKSSQSCQTTGAMKREATTK